MSRNLARLALPAIIAVFLLSSLATAQSSDLFPDFGAPKVLQPGTVTLHGSATCLNGAPKESICKSLTVSCPGLPDINGTIGVAQPANAIGTIILLAGGPGVNFLDDGFAVPYYNDGFNVVQLAWAKGSDWPDANDVGIKVAACRPAAIFKWVYQNVQKNKKTIGFCGQGISGGGGEFGYGLADYGMANYFDYVVIASGPGVTRMDYGCDPPLYTGPALNLCPLLTDAPYAYPLGNPIIAGVNKWEGTTTCGESNPLQSDITLWARDSLWSSASNYTYPKTAISWFFCTTPASLTENTGQGDLLYQQITAKNSPSDINCYSGVCSGEEVWQDQNAVSDTMSDMLTNCVPNHNP
ncbi:MAG TPA: hypothetical protein VGZ29_01610 [Terriglobia bacterium]|nr:hypothetical protein [Terriglobia bacterium]